MCEKVLCFILGGYTSAMLSSETAEKWNNIIQIVVPRRCKVIEMKTNLNRLFSFMNTVRLVCNDLNSIFTVYRANGHEKYNLDDWSNT